MLNESVRQIHRIDSALPVQVSRLRQIGQHCIKKSVSSAFDDNNKLNGHVLMAQPDNDEKSGLNCWSDHPSKQ